MKKKLMNYVAGRMLHPVLLGTLYMIIGVLTFSATVE